MDTTKSSKNGNKKEKHVAVFALPFASHPALLLAVTRRLASAAPNVVFSFFNTEPSNRLLFSELNCDNILPNNISNGTPEGFVFSGNHDEGMNLFLAVANEEYRNGVRAAEMDTGLKISCLVVDAFLWFTADIAEEMNISWVPFWPGGTCSFAAHLYTDLIREKCAQLIGSTRQDEVVDLVPGLKSIQLRDLPDGVVLGDLESPWAILPLKMGRTLTRATAVPASSFQELEEELDPDVTKNISSKLNNFLTIGPLNLTFEETKPSKSDEYSCISWLDTQKIRSVAYICFGRVCTPPPHELVELAEALEETKTVFLWSINKDATKHLPNGFLERIRANGTGKVVPWAPQEEVLNHVAVRVFVVHGGWNSVLESVGAGVPMICRPFFGDHHINSWMVERLGTGLRIKGGSFTKHATCHALEQVFSDSKLRDERVKVLKDLAHKTVAPNGSSNKNFKTLVDVVTGTAT